MVDDSFLDRCIHERAPDNEQVRSWYTQSISTHDLGLKSKAVEAYSKLTTYAYDKELARSMPARIPWQEYSARPFESSLYDELGQGAYLVDLFQVLECKAKMLNMMPATVDSANVIDVLLHSSSWLGLLVLATCTKAQVLYVPRHARLPESIKLSWNQKVPSYSSQLLILVVEEGADITICDLQEIHQGVHTSLMVGFLGKAAQVKVVREQAFGADAHGIALETWYSAQESKLTIIEGLTGGKQTVTLKDYRLEGKNASIEHLALSSLGLNEQAALITRQQHQSPSTKSSVHVKSLLRDAAQSFYRGTIRIKESAAASDADQQQKSLLIGVHARTCAIPSLEVATHDVRCRHGSATGRFSKEDLWYVASRGLDEHTARSLLIDGFYSDHPLVHEHAQTLNGMIKRLSNG